MNKLLTKKNVFIEGAIGTVLITGVAFLAVSDFCYYNTVCMNFFRTFDPWNIVNYILFTIPVLLLSLITYKMRDEIFAAWISFAVWWVPISILAILLTPTDDGGSFSIPLKGPLAFFCAAALFVISLILITYKHFTLKKRGAGE